MDKPKTETTTGENAPQTKEAGRHSNSLPGEGTAPPPTGKSSTLILETDGEQQVEQKEIRFKHPIMLCVLDSSDQREMEVETLRIHGFTTEDNWTLLEGDESRTIQLSGGVLTELGEGSVLIEGTEEHPLFLGLVVQKDGNEQHEGLCVRYSAMAEETTDTEESAEQMQTIKVEKTEDSLLLTDTMSIHATDESSGWQIEGRSDRIQIRNYRQGESWSRIAESGAVSDEQSIQIRGGSCVELEDGSFLIEGTEEQPLWLDLEDIAGHREHEGVCVIYHGELLARPVETPKPTTPWLLLGGAVMLTALIAAGLPALIRKLRKRKKEEPTALSFAQMQNVGKRPNQQDSVAAVEVNGGLLVVVADGMGGLRNGDLVSKKVVQTICTEGRRLSAEQLRGGLMPLLARTNDEVNRMLGPNGLYQSGSTLVAAVAEPERIRWISVGDSRIYLWRAGKLLQLNREHNYEAELLVGAVNHQISFQDAWNNPKRGSVTSFLGMGSLKHVDEMQTPIRTMKGDRFLLCSDGVYNTLKDETIEEILAGNPEPEQALQKLEAAVLRAGIVHQDNFSAVIVCYD